jgi:predicted DNA-binding ArsR family transcriptional regulator
MLFRILSQLGSMNYAKMMNTLIKQFITLNEYENFKKSGKKNEINICKKETFIEIW